MIEKVETDIDREEMNIETSQQIMDRIKVETILTKEKVKEIQKVVLELDKKIKMAKILETYALHSREELSNEKKEFANKI